MRHALLAIALFAIGIFAGARAHADWTLVKHDGRDHVTAANIAEFYGLGPVQREGATFTMSKGQRRLKGRIGSAEFYINRLKFILSYPAAERDGQPIISRMDLVKLIEPVLRPSKIRNAEPIRTVILDPGHGGHDHGARSIYGSEKNYALDVAKRCKAFLESRGYKVYLTRTSDYFVPLEDRAKFANQFSNAIFISIHFNSGGAHASGLEVFTLAPRGVPSMASDGPRMSDLVECRGNKRDGENMALATATHAALVGRSRMYDRGIKRARFVVIREIEIPGVLVEGGFLSNPGDAKLIHSVEYRNILASGLATAVENYKRATTAPPSTPVARGPNISLREPVVETGAGTAEPAREPPGPAEPHVQHAPEPDP